MEQTNDAMELTVEQVAAETPEVAMPNAAKEPWYQRLGRNGGACAALCAGALLVVALASGASAYVGAQAASHDGNPEAYHGEQFDRGAMRGQGTLEGQKGQGVEGSKSQDGLKPDEGSKSGDGLKGRSQGNAPGLEDSAEGAPDTAQTPPDLPDAQA